MSTELAHRQPEQLSITLLRPLLDGKPVVLTVQDSRMPKRKRAPNPLLFIAPVAVYGAGVDKLVISFQTFGCEVVDIYPKIDPKVFYRLGLGASLSKALCRSLNDVFSLKGETHGNT